MSNADQLAEPTMDEILASIRKIIADDPAADSAEQADDDILDLSDALISDDANAGGPAPATPPAAGIDAGSDMSGVKDVGFAPEVHAAPMAGQAPAVMPTGQPDEFAAHGGAASAGFDPMSATPPAPQEFANAPDFASAAPQQPAMDSALAHEGGQRVPDMTDIAQQEADLMADIGFAVEAEEASPISPQMPDAMPQMAGTDPMAAPSMPGGTELPDMESTIPEAFAGTAGEVEMPSQMRMDVSQATDVDRSQDFGAPSQMPSAADAGLAAANEGLDKPYGTDNSEYLAEQSANSTAMSADPTQTLADGLGSDVAALMAGAGVSAADDQVESAPEDPLAAVGFAAGDNAADSEGLTAQAADEAAAPESYYEEDDEGPVTGSLLQDAVKAQLEPAPQEEAQEAPAIAESLAAVSEDVAVSATADPETAVAPDETVSSMDMESVEVEAGSAPENVTGDMVADAAVEAPVEAEPAVAVQAPPPPVQAAAPVQQAAPAVEPAPAVAAAASTGTVPRTLEQSIQELLKPVLREWLDDNMPRIVEGALRDEMGKKD